MAEEKGKSGKGKRRRGLLIRGDDGKLYFIGDNDLERFELSEDEAKKMSESLDLDDHIVTAFNPKSVSKTNVPRAAGLFIVFVNVSSIRRQSDEDEDA